jgi:exopolyphosphatase/pppGpp-phosphohydrolase
VRDALQDVRPLRPDLGLAVGGSARALARIVGPIFEPDAVDATIERLARRRSVKVARAYDLEPTRARTLLAGVILLGEAGRTLDRPLTLAAGGLREGAALALASEGAVGAAA